MKPLVLAGEIQRGPVAPAVADHGVALMSGCACAQATLCLRIFDLGQSGVHSRNPRQSGHVLGCPTWRTRSGALSASANEEEQPWCMR